MKASDLIKKPVSIEEIYNHIQGANEYGDFRYFCPPHKVITDEVKLKLISDGFKVYEKPDFLGLPTLIIEW